MNRMLWFRICNGTLISVHACDLEYVKDITITIFPGDERPIRRYELPLTPEKYTHIMDLVISFKGVIDR